MLKIGENLTPDVRRALTPLGRTIYKDGGKRVQFEYTPERIQPALDRIDHLTKLGKYEYHSSTEESMVLGSSEWLRAVDMPQFVREVIVHRGGSFGDIYAGLVSTKSFDYECE